jgi:hypothetical protein
VSVAAGFGTDELVRPDLYAGRTLSVHYVPTPTPGRSYDLVLQGLAEHPRVLLCDSPSGADFVFWHFQAWDSRLVFPRERLVYVDWSDDPLCIYPVDPLVYFKRSWPYPSSTSRLHSLYDVPNAPRYVLEQPRRPSLYQPTSYCVMDDFVVEEELERDIDLACFLRPNQERRAVVLHLLEQLDLPGLRVHLGPVSDAGRDRFDSGYLHALRRSKIVVTVGPDWAEGDSRTWEALANGPLVVQPEMLTPLPEPFVDGRHIAYFRGDDLLSPTRQREFLELVVHHLERLDDAVAIGAAGRAHALRHHRAVNRVDAMLRAAVERS